MKLIVGLGNPGRKYEATRHNAGFWWVDEVARAANASFRAEARFSGEVAKAQGSDSWLLKPQTFMNLSGRAVGALANFYRIAPSDILVAHDELDLPPGGVKLKFGGGLSGNGLKDVAAVLGTRDFWRLRIGIGHPGSRDLVTPYVLGRANVEDGIALDLAVRAAADSVPEMFEHGAEPVMQQLHTRQP